MRLHYSLLCSLLDIPLENHPQEDSVVDPFVTHVAYDSREVTPMALFACIKGAVTDGHLYAKSAIEAGATLLLAERPIPEASVPVLVVKDTVRALQTIATYVRAQTKACVIGITGTCGKTTVKELIASVLAQAGKTAKSPGNNNNQLGMACGIINTDGDEDFWVFEAGISHEGDMEALGAMLRPNLALIINVGLGHTEGLGDRGVAWHKAQLLTSLAENGTGIVSADYPELVWKAYGTHKNIIFFTAKASQDSVANNGPSLESANFATWLSPTELGLGRYQVHIQGNSFPVTIPLSGQYACENVIAAALTAHLAGASNEAICEGFRTVQLPKQRFVVSECEHSILIDDTYNANPLSMESMLGEAARIAKDRPLFLLLGEMRELGRVAAEAHETLGQSIAKLAPAAVFWKGDLGPQVEQGLRKGNYTGPFLPVDSPDSFRAAFESLLPARDRHFVLLAKGSRANQLETCLAQVRDLL